MLPVVAVKYDRERARRRVGRGKREDRREIGEAKERRRRFSENHNQLQCYLFSPEVEVARKNVVHSRPLPRASNIFSPTPLAG